MAWKLILIKYKINVYMRAFFYRVFPMPATPSILSESAQILKFLTAGKAFFTLESKVSGTRYTFKVSTPKRDKMTDAQAAADTTKEVGPWFVSVLVGPDNWTNYKFFGTIFAPRTGEAGHTFRYSMKSAKVGVDAPSVMAFTWFFNNLKRGALSQLNFWHAGKCGRCGRMLTVPTSIESGFGPECITKV